MNLRVRLTLSIIAILVLFSVNMGTASWVDTTRTKQLDSLQKIMSSQLTANSVRQKIDRFEQLLMRTEPAAELKYLSLTIAAFETNLSQFHSILPTDATPEYNNIVGHSQTALAPIKEYLRATKDASANNKTLTKPHESLDNIIDLVPYIDALDAKLLSLSNSAFSELKSLESLTRTISLVVFVLSIILTVGLGTILIGYTNSAFKALKRGTIAIGSGDFDYRIPVERVDEVGEACIAFNSMSEKLQIAIADVQQAKDNADFANRAKSDFLANMSHELRTPLNAIIGYSEMMQEDIEQDQLDQRAQNEDIERILIAARHLLNQINDVLDLSKIESGKMTVYNESFDCKNVLQDVMATLSPLAQRGANTLNLQHASDLTTMFQDVTKFRQLFFNLLSNACKFTENGNITLGVTVEKNQDKAANAIFTVKDDGIGMTQEQTETIFQAFHQADSSTTRQYGGTGLGLALCEQYCELMGGEISVESKEGIGTRFTVRLPIRAS